MIIGVRKWAIVVGIATIACGFFGALIGGWRSSPEPCSDGVAILSVDTYPKINCVSGAKLEIDRQGTVMLAKCLCSSVQR